MLCSQGVSKRHAELRLEHGVLRVIDLGSRNGTFVNGEPVEQSELREGDILCFADLEFRVGRRTDESPKEWSLDLKGRQAVYLRIPEHRERRFRLNVNGDSGHPER